MDSTALLHALSRSRPAIPLKALHVDHGLHADSGDWDRRAAAFAGSLGVEYESIAVTVDSACGRGPEAAAREARYAALKVRLQPGDWLLSAHHLDDQAETLLLNLMRGSGPLGLAGMEETRSLGAGLLVRPLLNLERASQLYDPARKLLQKSFTNIKRD